MQPRFGDCVAAFSHSLARADDMVELFDVLNAGGANSVNDDALRAAYIQAVSSFDFFVHELVAVEATHRFSNEIETKNILVPFQVIMMKDAADRINAFSGHFRQTNSYKAFVDPAKIGGILSCFCGKPWPTITALYNATHHLAETEDSLKGRLKSIWQRRNKIAHEADINPALSGISLWPIDKSDVVDSIEFIDKLGRVFPEAVEILLPPS